MILFGNLLFYSILYCCSCQYPGRASVPIEHGKFFFTAPAVSFLERRKFGIDYMVRIEELIQQNPGVSSINYDGNFHVSVAGIKNGERHLGCFSGDDKCRIIGFLEMPE